MSKKLENKVALVTGASKGIGAAVARHLARAGAAVVVNYASSQSQAEQVVADIEKEGGRAVALQADVGDPEQIVELMGQIKESFGRLDVLVNNAGVYKGAPFGEITPKHFHHHFDVNVLGLILVSQEASKLFPSEGGVIINVSSVVSALSPPGLAVYNATKSAVDGITRTFAQELAGRHIRVNSINPGLISTEGTRAEGLVQDGVDHLPGMGRVGSPDHIASGVVFLATSDSAWMNGETLTLTGGR